MEEVDRKTYMTYTDCNGEEHKIATVIPAKQDKAYENALKSNCDAYVLHMLHISDYQVPQYMIAAKIKMINLRAEHEYEIKRIEDMPPRMLEIEMELKYGYKKSNLDHIIDSINSISFMEQTNNILMRIIPKMFLKNK